jgi:hypothetical protein
MEGKALWGPKWLSGHNWAEPGLSEILYKEPDIALNLLNA